MGIKKLLPGVKKNVLLKNYTTFRIGGPAKYFFIAKTKEEIIKAIKWAKENKLPFFILGEGSNILVSDKGFNGLVIKFGQPLSFYVLKTKRRRAEWGEAKVKKKTMKFSSPGLEWAAGIPGTIQGAVYG
ncbi:MAG: FAD-binding protein, partial [Patescibacteria group bacterium]|nr:FAD-binding protein [Patescibacteria group bacterium]